MKKLIIPFLLICFLTGCASSGNTTETDLDNTTIESGNETSLDKTPAESVNESDTDKSSTENVNEVNLDKTCIMNQLSFKVSSTWEHNNSDGTDYFYPPDGSMIFVSNANLGKAPANDTDMQSNILQAYDGFIGSASNVKTISDNFDLKNNIHTVTFTADYGKDTQYLNYYATVKDKYLYCIVLIGETNSQEKLDTLFKEIISNLSFENNTQESIGIGLTKDEIINMMDERLKKNQLPAFSDASIVGSTTEIEGFGPVAYEIYTLTNGIDFEFYIDIETDALLQVMYIVDKSQLSLSAYEVVGFINTSLPYLFEKDTYRDLDKKLDMNSDKESYETIASGADREYYYYKSDEFSALVVYPVGKDILFRTSETTSPSAGTSVTPSPSTIATPSPAPTQKQTQPTSQPKQNISPQITPSSTPKQTKPSAPTNTPTPKQPTPSAPTNTPTPKPPTPSVPTNTPTPEPPTPSPTPTPTPTPVPIVNEPKFTAEVTKETKFKNLITIEGTLSGISSPEDVSITCYFPNGETRTKIIDSVENNGRVFYIFETGKGGIGSGYVTVSLVSTGEVLEEYDFTVIPR